MGDLVSPNVRPWMEILSGDVEVYFSGVAVRWWRFLIDWLRENCVAYFSMSISRNILESSQKSPCPLQHLNKLCPSSHRRKLWLWFRLIKNDPRCILFRLFVTVLNLQMQKFKFFSCNHPVSLKWMVRYNFTVNQAHSTLSDFQSPLVFIKLQLNNIQVPRSTSILTCFSLSWNIKRPKLD